MTAILALMAGCARGGGGATGLASVSTSRVIGVIPGAGTFTTPAVTVTAAGGTAPYSYAWSRRSGDASIAADAAGSATTSFSGFVDNGDEVSAVMACLVTDSHTPANTGTVYVTAEGRSTSTI